MLGMQASTTFTQTLLLHAELLLTFAAADQYAKRAQLVLELDAAEPPPTTVDFGLLLTTADCQQRTAYYHLSDYTQTRNTNTFFRCQL